MKVRLPAEMLALLLEVATKYGIDIYVSSTSDGELHLRQAQRETLVEAISSEFVSTGLRPDSEPNDRGLKLEDLLDRLNRPRESQ